MTIKRRFGLNRRMHPVLISPFPFTLLNRICFFETVLSCSVRVVLTVLS
ncbi:unnamed protein product, partial [Brassica rapa]